MSYQPCLRFFKRLCEKASYKSCFNTFLSPYLCGYRKGFSTQYALSLLLEKWKKIVGNKGFASGVLMDLSKAFDTLNHGLLITKLRDYRFGKESIVLLLSYLSNCWQRTKINTSFSSWAKLLQVCHKGQFLVHYYSKFT